MVARKPQPMDLAALAYIKQKQDAKGLSRAELADRAGIPYQTVRKWWDSETGVTLSVADVRNFLRALDIPGDEAYQEIERIAVSIENAAKN